MDVWWSALIALSYHFWLTLHWVKLPILASSWWPEFTSCNVGIQASAEDFERRTITYVSFRGIKAFEVDYLIDWLHANILNTVIWGYVIYALTSTETLA